MASVGVARWCMRSAGSTSRCGTSAASWKASRCPRCSAGCGEGAWKPMRRCCNTVDRSSTCAATSRGRSNGATVTSSCTSGPRTASRRHRDVAGPDIPIMVDTNCAWTADQATAPVAAMAPSKPFWVEEPIWPPEDFDALAVLRRATGVPLAMGENATGVLDFQKMISAGATDFVQPSVVKIGGLTNLWQVATEAEKAGVTCVPHAFFFGPGYLATLHAIAAKERAAPLERLFGDVGFTAYAKSVPVVDGAIDVPDRPGLGADPEEDMIDRFRA